MARKGESEVKVVKPIAENLEKALGELRLAIADPERKKVLEAEVVAIEKEVEELTLKLEVLEERKGKLSEKLEEIEVAEKKLGAIRESLEEA